MVLKVRCMLASVGAVEHIASYEYRNMIFEPKLDGVRFCCGFKNGAYFAHRRRNGDCKLNKIFGLKEFLVETYKIIQQDFFLDGEVVLRNGNGEIGYEESAGYVNNKIRQFDTNFVFVVFDLFRFDRPAEPFKLRRLSLEELFGCVPSQANKWSLELIEQSKSWENAKVWYETLEGVMAKTTDHIYQFGFRSKGWLKLKRVHVEDAVAVNYNRGSGKNKQRVGALYCYLLHYPHIKFHVGSGLSDKLREELTDKSRYPFIFEVTYQSKTRTGSLRFPRFKRLKPLE